MRKALGLPLQAGGAAGLTAFDVATSGGLAALRTLPHATVNSCTTDKKNFAAMRATKCGVVALPVFVWAEVVGIENLRRHSVSPFRVALFAAF